MFKRIYFFFLTYLASVTYGQTLLFLWFKEHGVSYFGMFFYALSNFLGAIILYLLVNGKIWNSRTSLRLGVLLSASGVFMASVMTNPWQAFFVGLLFVGPNVFFWTIYNTMHFKYGEKKEHGYKSGLYFLLVSIIGAIFAPLSGFVAENFGYQFLFMSGLCVYILPLCLVSIMPSFDFEFKTIESVYKTENKLLIFFQGCNSIIGMSLIPIFTLFFIKDPLELGGFFGYLALLSAFVALVNSKISDRLKKRALFFYFFAILNSLSYLPIVLINSLTGWQLFTGINSITSKLSNPFDISLILDHSKLDVSTTMLGREMYVNAGRVAMLILALFVLWLTQSFIIVLVVSCLTSMFYPIIAYYQKIYLLK